MPTLAYSAAVQTRENTLPFCWRAASHGLLVLLHRGHDRLGRRTIATQQVKEHRQMT